MKIFSACFNLFGLCFLLGSCSCVSKLHDVRTVTGEEDPSAQQNTYVFTEKESVRDLQARPSNDFCAQAETIRLDSSLTGSTVGASNDIAIASMCNGVGHVGPGVWFRIVGDGTRFIADTCSSDTDFDTVVSVYSGGCRSLVCVGANDDHFGLCTNGNSTQSSVSWNTVARTQYYIHVHGFLGSSGVFNLDVTSKPLLRVPKGRDFCSQAESIRLGSAVNRSSVGASNDIAIAAECNGVAHVGPGVWFRIGGDGTRFTAETCSVDTDFDTVVSVYSGSCRNLACVEANDDHNGACVNSVASFHSSVSWDTSVGRSYYIHVHGFGGTSGEFHLAVNRSP